MIIFIIQDYCKKNKSLMTSLSLWLIMKCSPTGGVAMAMFECFLPHAVEVRLFNHPMGVVVFNVSAKSSN